MMSNKQKARQVNIRLTPDYHRRLRVIAAEKGLTAGEVVKQWIDEHIRAYAWQEVKRAK